jgi:hypothetical protein
MIYGEFLHCVSHFGTQLWNRVSPLCIKFILCNKVSLSSAEACVVTESVVTNWFTKVVC